MRYLLEKNNSWFCYSTLLTQQTLRSEGLLWKPLIILITFVTKIEISALNLGSRIEFFTF